ncbi:MAG: hypothetical protein EXQ55_08000 [Acidobacteria bacterium]|nr:hypothetical protein [Acidobacteriota bacterium]
MDETRDMYPGADRRADRREGADRRAQSERRGDFRGGRRLSDAVRVGVLSLSLFAAAGGAARAAEAPVRRPVATSTKSGPMRFGVDVDSVKDLKAKGVDVSYGNF